MSILRAGRVYISLIAIFYLASIFVRPSFAAPYRVFTPTPLGPSEVRRQCEYLLGGISAFQGVAVENIPIYFLSETYDPERASTAGQTHPFLLDTLPQLAAARLNNKQQVDPNPLKVTHDPLGLLPDILGTVVGLEFGARLNGQEYRILVNRRDASSRLTPKSRSSGASRRSQHEWVWTRGEQFPVSPNFLTGSKMDEPHQLKVFDDIPDFRKQVSAVVAATILAYDLQREMTGGDHDLDGRQYIEGFCNSVSAGLKWEPRRVAAIVHENSPHRFLGFVAWQDLVSTIESVAEEPMYRKHFEGKLPTERRQVERRFRLAAYFDADGNRLDPWTPEKTQIPRGALVEAEQRVDAEVLRPGGFETLDTTISPLREKKHGVSRHDVASNGEALRPEPRVRSLATEWQNVIVGPVVSLPPKAASEKPEVLSFDYHPSAGAARTLDTVISPNGRYLLVQTNQQLTLHDLWSNRPAIEFGIPDRVTAATFSRDGATLYLGHPENWLRVLDVKSGRTREMHLLDKKPHMFPKAPTKIIEVPENRLVVSFGATRSEDRNSVLAFLASRDYMPIVLRTGPEFIRQPLELLGANGSEVYFRNQYSRFYEMHFQSIRSPGDYPVPGTIWLSPSTDDLSNSGADLVSPSSDHMLMNDGRRDGGKILYRRQSSELTALYTIGSDFDGRPLNGRFSLMTTDIQADGSSLLVANHRSKGFYFFRIPKSSSFERPEELTLQQGIQLTEQPVDLATFSRSGRFIAFSIGSEITIRPLLDTGYGPVFQGKLPGDVLPRELIFSEDELSLVAVRQDGSLVTLRSEGPQAAQ